MYGNVVDAYALPCLLKPSKFSLPPMVVYERAITELAEFLVSDQTIMSIAGLVSTRMLAHYSHVRLENRRKALDALSSRGPDGGYVTKHGTIEQSEGATISQVIENMVDVTGFEPATPCLQSRCSPS